MPKGPDYVVPARISGRALLPRHNRLSGTQASATARSVAHPVLSDPGVMLGGMALAAQLDRLDELLDKQLCVVSRGQLLALGMKDNAMQYRVRRGGPWQTLLPGVYLAVSGAPSLTQKEMAA